MAFCNRIKEARKAKGYTQTDLGELIGVKKATVSGYESGKSEPSMAITKMLMNALDVDANFLWQDDLDDITNPNEKATRDDVEGGLDSLLKSWGVSRNSLSAEKIELIHSVVKAIVESDVK